MGSGAKPGMPVGLWFLQPQLYSSGLPPKGGPDGSSSYPLIILVHRLPKLLASQWPPSLSQIPSAPVNLPLPLSLY